MFLLLFTPYFYFFYSIFIYIENSNLKYLYINDIKYKICKRYLMFTFNVNKFQKIILENKVK